METAQVRIETEMKAAQVQIMDKEIKKTVICTVM